MALLIVGILLFVGIHSVSIVDEGWRDRVVGRLGLGFWRGLHSVATLAGLAMIVIGYGLARRAPVLIYAPPNMVAEAVKHGGYEPIAKIPGRLAPAFMAMTRSQIAFVEDMKGKRLGTTDKDSLMTQLGMLHLRNQGIDPDHYFGEVRHFADVNAVIFALVNNMIDVGLANTTLYNVWTNRGYNLALIEQAPGVPHLTFAVRGDLPVAEKRAILQVLLSATKDPDASVYFRKTGFPGVEPTSMKDYTDLVERLHIQ